MKKKILLTAVLISSAALAFAQPQPPANPTPEPLAWYSNIEKLTDLKGSYNADQDVFKVTSPRNDVKVSVDQWAMPPFMGLTSWAAFTKGSKDSFMLMGDMVLFQDEVNPVMSAALDNGLDVTALHNHFFFDDPKVYFMHIHEEGTIEQLTAGLHKIFDTVKAIRTVNPQPVNSFGTGAIAPVSLITPKLVDDILGTKGQSKDGMYKMVVGRKTKMSCGCDVGKDMGINTWAAFAGTDDKAIVDGDFAVKEEELQTVLKTLRKSNINIVAIHSHLTGEDPRFLFIHYWGVGAVSDLSKGLKAALDTQKI